ncbi:MAG: MBL fold metallo-hydrolase [Phycisphaerales bacterium]
MSIELCVLGSGSAGNCSVVRFTDADHVVLIDAGFGPRATAKRLDGTGVTLGHIRAMLLTHLDRDHFSPNWYRTILERQIPIHLHQKHLAEFYQILRAANASTSGGGGEPMVLHRDGLIRPFTDQPFTLQLAPDSAVGIRPVALSHDAQGTTGYILRRGEHRLAYATDLGHVPDTLLHAMLNVHLLAIESNYDPQMQLDSPRPAMLKHRIMSSRGHLSNEQTLQALQHLFTQSHTLPARIVLLHLSRQCNCPRLLEQLYAPHPRIAERLHLSSQHQRTPWLGVTPAHAPLQGEQIAMFER